jgi:hypothetical protein
MPKVAHGMSRRFDRAKLAGGVRERQLCRDRYDSDDIFRCAGFESRRGEKTVGQSRDLVAMKDPEFFKTLEQHRPTWQVSNYVNARLAAVDADLRRWALNASISHVLSCRAVISVAATCVGRIFMPAILHRHVSAVPTSRTHHLLKAILITLTSPTPSCTVYGQCVQHSSVPRSSAQDSSMQTWPALRLIARICVGRALSAAT